MPCVYGASGEPRGSTGIFIPTGLVLWRAALCFSLFVCVCVFVCVLSSRCLVCRPSACVCVPCWHPSGALINVKTVGHYGFAVRTDTVSVRFSYLIIFYLLSLPVCRLDARAVRSAT